MPPVNRERGWAGALRHPVHSHTWCSSRTFAASWLGLARRDGTTPHRGPAPEVREQALLALARGVLSGDGVEPGAWVAALRFDALVRPATVWRLEQFTSDLVRDLAVAQLLITDGWQPLQAAGRRGWRRGRFASHARRG